MQEISLARTAATSSVAELNGSCAMTPPTIGHAPRPSPASRSCRPCRGVSTSIWSSQAELAAAPGVVIRRTGHRGCHDPAASKDKEQEPDTRGAYDGDGGDQDEKARPPVDFMSHWRPAPA